MVNDSPRKYLSRLEQEVLTVLGSDQSYGLEIQARINRARKVFEIPPMTVGSLYPALKRMEESGLLEVEKRKRRVYYRASTLGVDSLNGMIQYRGVLAAWGDRLNKN